MSMREGNKMKNWMTLLLLLTQSALAGVGQVQQQDIKTAAQCTTAGAPLSACLPLDQQIYVTANGINSQLSTAISSGLIGGGGGSSGINLLSDPGFEITGSLSSYWTATGGTLAEVTSGSNLLIGGGSATYQATASSQSMQSSLYAIPNGLKGANCSASMLYLGADTNYFFTVSNGSSTIASQQLTAVSSPTPLTLTFQCPTSGSLQIEIVSIASGAIMALDQMFLGQNTNISSISQASLWAASTVNCGSGWTATGSSSGAFSPQTCTYANQGNAQTPSTGVPGMLISSLPPAHYVLEYTGYVTATGNSNQFTVGNGSSNYTLLNGDSDQATVYTTGTTYFPTVRVAFDVATGLSNQTVQMMYSIGASGTVSFGNEGTFKLYRYPNQSQMAVNPNTINWIVDANQANTSGSIALASGVVSGIDFISDATTQMYQNPGSQAVQQPCSANPPVGPQTNCASSTNEVGIIFNVPSAGTVQACAYFTWGGSSTAGVEPIFTLVQTGLQNDSIVQTSNTNLASGITATNGISPFSLCGPMTFTSAGPVALKLVYTQAGSGTITSEIFSSRASAVFEDIHWVIKPITQNVPAPILVGSVNSSASGSEVLNRAQIAACGSDPCTINNQSGSWLTAVNRNSAGNYTAHIASGTFSAAPTCTFSSGDSSVPMLIDFTPTTSSAITIEALGSTFSAADIGGQWSILCQGPH